MDAAQAGTRPRPGIGRYVVAVIVALMTDAALFFVVSVASGLLFQVVADMALWVWLASASVVITGGAWVGTRVAGLQGLVPYVVVLALNLGLSAFGLWAALSWVS